MKAVHFGAGAIGRGFVAERLHRSGYEITFVDVNGAVIDALDTAGSFDIYWIEDGLRRESIDGIHALHSRDTDAVVDAIAEANLVTTSVWASNLFRLAPVIAAALERRAELGRPPLEFIPCENAVGNGDILAAAVAGALPDRDTEWITAHARFPNTAVDRMVYDASQRDGVAPVDVGIDYELVIDRAALIDPDGKPIVGAHYVDQLEPFLERKLFIINGGHARASYLGALRGYTTMPEVFGDAELLERTRRSMLQAAAVMQHDYGFDRVELEKYVDFSLRRWQTPGVTDDIARVGRSPIRKLAAHERLVAPALRAAAAGLPNDLLLEGVAAALLYSNPLDDEAVELQNTIDEIGPALTLTRCSAPEEPRNAVPTGESVPSGHAEGRAPGPPFPIYLTIGGA